MGRKDLTQERRDEILDATEHCIVKYGLQGTTLSNIASEAGINRGLIHHYIGNREDVIRLLLERLLEKYQNSFETYAATRAESNYGEIVLDYYFEAWFDLAPDDDALLIEFLAASERDPHIRKSLQTLYEGFENMIARELFIHYPNAGADKINEASYSLMVFAFAHATIAWLGLPNANKVNVRAVANTLIQTLK